MIDDAHVPAILTDVNTIISSKKCVATKNGYGKTKLDGCVWVARVNISVHTYSEKKFRLVYSCR